MSDRALEALSTVQIADVYKSGQLAATLRRASGQTEFCYLPKYLEGGGPPIATSLACTKKTLVTPAGAVPPFFAGLLPEGRRLSSLRRAVKTSADDELSLLLAVGRDAIGDVQIVPEGTRPTPAEPLIQVSKHWSEVRFAEVLASAGVVDPVALPGVQDKASARMISVPVARSGERYLLKIDPPEYPLVVANEAFFLSRARNARIDCVRATVVQDVDGRPGLLVRRFDRIPLATGQAAALPCEDACQVLGRWPADKYNFTAEEVVMGLARHCAAQTLALRNFFQQICFAWLTGNGDVHAKNLSILGTGTGEWRASPAYDLPSTVPYGDTSLALALQGRTRGISRRHLLGFAAEIGLPERVGTRVLDELLVRLTDLKDTLRSAVAFPAKTTADLIKELRYRRRQALPAGM